MATERVRAALDVVSRFLIAEAPLGETLEHIATLAQEAIEPADAVAVTLLDDTRRPITAVSTDRVAAEIDQAQYDEDTGPCLDAFRTGVVVRVDDTAAMAHVWPAFSRRAVAAGISSTLALPLNAGGETFGVLNMYARSAGAFAGHESDDTGIFVTQVAVVLANTRAYWNMFDLATGLRIAMTSRAAIEQAKGIVMATKGCDAEEAFSILRLRSQTENRKLRDVAMEIISAERGVDGP